MKKTYLVLAILLFALSSMIAQTQIHYNDCFSATSGWVFYSAGGEAIQQGGYWLVDNSGDFIVSQAFNVTTYSNLTLDFQVGTYGSGANNPCQVQYSTDNGANWNATTFTSNTPTSSTLISSGTWNIGTFSNANLFKLRWSRPASSGRGVRIDNIYLRGTAPALLVNPITLSGYSYVQGNGPSTSQSYSLSGSNLTGYPGNITVSGSSNYEVSTDNSDFGSSKLVAYSSATLASTQIWIRLKAGLTAGNYNSETISNAGGGATTQNVTCSGTVTMPPPPNAPVATDETNVASDGFTATWNSVTGATGYELDVYYYSAVTYATDLIVSEYVEGSSSNKYIEIYNGTGSAKDLSNYYLRLYTNGAASPTNDVILTGTIAHGDTYVYKNSSAALTLPAGVTAITNTAVNFNGNDAVALYYNDGTKAAYFVDIFGRIGDDPGTAWTGAGGYTTADRTLVRKASVKAGVSTNPTGTGPSAFTTLTTEWDMYNTDTASYLGSHTMSLEPSKVYVTGYEAMDVGNVTDYVVTGLDPSTNYYYVVRAYNAYGTGTSSNEIEVTTDDEPLPVVLSSFTASISVQNNVMLTWVTQTETGMLGYYIYRSGNSQLANAELVSPMISATNTATQQIYSYTDSELYTSGDYYYWLESVDFDGNNGFHGPVSVLYDTSGEYYNPEVPLATELKAIYPNPFNPLAFIPFSLASTADVSIQIYNNRGQLLRDLDLGTKIPGEYRIEWNGTDNNGQPLSTGVYYIRMTAGKDSFQRKAVLLK